MVVKHFKVVGGHHAHLSSELTQPPVHLLVEVLLNHRDHVALPEGELIGRLCDIVVACLGQELCLLWGVGRGRFLGQGFNLEGERGEGRERDVKRINLLKQYLALVMNLLANKFSVLQFDDGVCSAIQTKG